MFSIKYCINGHKINKQQLHLHNQYAAFGITESPRAISSFKFLIMFEICAKEKSHTSIKETLQLLALHAFYQKSEPCEQFSQAAAYTMSSLNQQKNEFLIHKQQFEMFSFLRKHESIQGPLDLESKFPTIHSAVQLNFNFDLTH